MIVLFNDNIDKTLKYLEENHGRKKQKVFIRILEGFDSLEGPDGEMGFGVFDVAHHTIYVAADIPEPERTVPYTIAHEYKHFMQWCDGELFDESEADLFADMVMSTLGINTDTVEV